VYAKQTDGYRYANAFGVKLINEAIPIGIDPPIRWQRGDVFFGLDMQHHVQLAQADFYAQLRQDGVVVKFLIYDLLPIQLEQHFQCSDLKKLHQKLLAMVAMQDQAICISKATESAYLAWLSVERIHTNPALTTDWVHMGADLDDSKPSVGLPSNVYVVLREIESRTTFLAVSTIEPRKAQSQILAAVEQIWADGRDVNLVLVGQAGWKVDALTARLVNHPEGGKRLFWLRGISDEYLDLVYKASSCLIAASLNEGFGLPLIEAARYGLPIIARDIPVFNEVAGSSAYYFEGETGGELAAALSEWLELKHKGLVPSSCDVQWLTWKQSTDNLKNALVGRNYARRQLLVDISELMQRDAKTGIQRVVRNILKQWLTNPPEGFRIEPVYATIDMGYCYARSFTASFMSLPKPAMADEPIEFTHGDVFFGLDLNHHVPRVHSTFLKKMYREGIRVYFMVYDLLPIQFPQFWEPKHQVHLVVNEWLSVISSLSGVVCISKAVAEDFFEWMKINNPTNLKNFRISWFHLGTDNYDSKPTSTQNEYPILPSQVLAQPSFLMVGTLELRKGYLQVLEAFQELWHAHANVNLVIVGKQGWMVDALVKQLQNHPELNKRLFWLEGMNDDYLEQAYAASTCLIAASCGEGFGLPLIEAAQHQLPIIARDTPVFREVAGDYAYYFEAQQPAELAQAIEAWLTLFRADRHPKSGNMPWLTWKESAAQLLTALNLPAPIETTTSELKGSN
jgi:glycosyltransferase involved in cell wall biosynthesis